MTDIRNINFGGIVPNKRMTCYNGQPAEIVRTYRIVKGVPEIIWDVGDIPPAPAVNEFIIVMHADDYYITIPAIENDAERHRGIIEWGDGTEEVYWSNARYSHDYDDTNEQNIRIYAPIAAISRDNAAGVFYQNKIDYIKFADSTKILGRFAFNLCYKIANIDFNNIEEIMSRAFFNSFVYFPYEPYDNYVDIELKNVKIIRSEAFYSSTALRSVHISDKIETIESNAFYNCSHLTEITIDKPINSVSGAPWGATKAKIIWRG